MTQAVSRLQNERHLYEACPLCASKSFHRFAKGDCTVHHSYDPALSPIVFWNTCTDCNHVFTDGYFTDEAAAIVFRKTQDNQTVGYNFEASRYVSAEMIEKVLPFQDKGHWLDIGFGNGSLLVTAQEFGFIPVGVDLRGESVTAIRQLGIEAYHEKLENLTFDKRFTVISMMDVLEHVPYPNDMLKQVYGLLEPGGVLFVSMPNSGSPIWHFLNSQNANPYWGEMEHYHNFSRERLYSLLDTHGFTPKRYGISKRYRACMEVVAIKQG
jgi:SAM-dependent methyltransferase